jgi:hypothetical protein
VAGEKLKEWLHSNLITKEAFEAAKADNFEQFIDIRAQNLHAAIAARANWPSHGDTRRQLPPETSLDDSD